MAESAVDEKKAAAIAQTERIGLGDLLVAGLLGTLTWILLQVWEFPGLHPSLWKEAVVASGCRPAEAILPGFWRAIASTVYSSFGLGGGNWIFRLLGHGLLTLIAVLIYAVMREMLAFIMRARPQRSKHRTLVMQLASAVGGFAFVSADTVWTAGQVFSETTILIALTLGALECFFLFLRKGQLKFAYMCAFLLGLLTAESPMGIAFTLGFIFINFFVLKVMPQLESPFFNPAVIAVGKWHMTFVLLGALIFGIALNCTTFILHDGLAAGGKSIGSLPLDYLLAYWGCVSHASGLFGWLLVLSVCIAPLLVSLVLFPAAADEELFLKYSTGLVFLFCGILAISQSCSLPALWFWTYGDVKSPYLLSVCNLFCAMTLACALTILGVDSLCRNHRRLARVLFGRDEEDAPSPADLSGSRSTVLLRLSGIVLVPSLIVLSMIPGRFKYETREMLDIINDGVAEIVREAADAEYIFTDGNLDAAVEMESRRQGRELKCLSLMSRPRAYDVWLLTRGMQNDAEDMMVFSHDCGMGLRTWIRDKPARLQRSAVQMGFDLWRRDGLPFRQSAACFPIPPRGARMMPSVSPVSPARKASPPAS